MVPADFSGAVFTCAFFQEMLFLLYKLRNAFLVTNDLSDAECKVGLSGDLIKDLILFDIDQKITQSFCSI